MQAITDASLTQKVNAEGRSLGRLAWHVVQTLGEMGGHAGLAVEAANEHTPQPVSAAAIAAAYQAGAGHWVGPSRRRGKMPTSLAKSTCTGRSGPAR